MIERCLNCDTPLDGDYCSTCGQSTGTLDVPIRSFAGAFLTEALSLDGRVRTTLGPLFLKPGQVARDFVEGRRARFVPPIRLYLVASFFMFLVSGLERQVDAAALAADGPPTEETVVEPTAPEEATDATRPDISDLEELGFTVDFGDSEFEAAIITRLNDGARRVLQDREGFYQDIANGLATAMFFLLPFFALLLKGTFRKRLYVHHAVFTLYLHCVAFFLIGLVTLPGLILPTWSGWWDLLIAAGIPIYTFLAMRTFYGSGWLGTTLRLGLVGFVYLITVAMVWLFVMLGSLYLA